VSAAGILASVNALDWMLSRRSSKVFGEGDVDEESVRQVLLAAVNAPDHGLLRPWRFVVFRGEGRARFGEALVAGAGEQGLVDDVRAAKQRSKAFVAPVFIALVASPKESPKVHRWEQLAAAASAGYAMLLAAHAVGLGAMWKSTPLRDTAAVRELLNLTEQEEFLGWVNLGPLPPPSSTVPPKPPVDLEDLVTEISS
jgi:nitroreductase